MIVKGEMSKKKSYSDGDRKFMLMLAEQGKAPELRYDAFEALN